MTEQRVKFIKQHWIGALIGGAAMWALPDAVSDMAHIARGLTPVGAVLHAIGFSLPGAAVGVLVSISTKPRGPSGDAGNAP